MAKFYLRPPSYLGGDNTGRTWANAWRGAIDWGRVEPGDLVYVGGTWRSDGGMVPLEILKPITLKGYPGDVPWFYGRYLSADGVSGFKLIGLTFFDYGQIRAEGAANVTISHCTFKRLDPKAIIAVELRKGNDGWQILDCAFRSCGNAIYTRVVGGGPAQRLTVKRCIFTDIAQGAWATKDGHAIGIQGGSGHRIIGNTVDLCGTAICAWSPASVPMTDIRIEGNRISRCRALEVATGSGIEISGSIEGGLPTPDMRRGIKVLNNQITDCDGYGISSQVPIAERGNNIGNCRAGARRIRNLFDRAASAEEE